SVGRSRSILTRVSLRRRSPLTRSAFIIGRRTGVAYWTHQRERRCRLCDINATTVVERLPHVIATGKSSRPRERFFLTKPCFRNLIWSRDYASHVDSDLIMTRS